MPKDIDSDSVKLLDLKYIGHIVNDYKKGVSYTLVYSSRPEVHRSTIKK